MKPNDPIVTGLADEVTNLLKRLIGTPSFSKEEDQVAGIMHAFLESKGFSPQRKGNNVWARTEFTPGAPVVLLNSHLDTVKPAPTWTLDPFTPTERDGKLHGLGSNDAGGPLVSLLATFVYLSSLESLPYNLIFLASAEEENSGFNGIESGIPELGPIDFGIIGEPTRMQMAIAEKGLMVLDGTAKGKSGHAARDEGENAIYKAMKDIETIVAMDFPRKSDLLGKVKLSVTQINAGTQHNVVPDTCTFVVDARVNEHYSNEEVFEIVKILVQSELKARSFRLNSSGLPLDHPFVKRGIELGIPYFGSPTTSDQAVVRFPTIKMGPGDSARSHTADEYIFPSEIREGIATFISLLEGLRFDTNA